MMLAAACETTINIDSQSLFRLHDQNLDDEAMVNVLVLVLLRQATQSHHARSSKASRSLRPTASFEAESSRYAGKSEDEKGYL